MKLVEFKKRLKSLKNGELSHFNKIIKTEIDWNKLEASLLKTYGVAINILPAMTIYNAALHQRKGDRLSNDDGEEDSKKTSNKKEIKPKNIE